MHRTGRSSFCSALLVPLISAAAAWAQHPQTEEAAKPATIEVDKLFATSCGWCHQSGGRIAGRGPKLAGTPKSDEELVRQIKNGKPPGMPAFGRNFSDEQIAAIIAYIRALPDTP
jgi:mono/diheme cytochrome c family protein